MRLHDTMEKGKREFQPAEAGRVTMYVCGPTVYNFIHIGNARCYVVFDVLYRWLKVRGLDVRYARNITDVDDKIINRANEEGIAPAEVAAKYEKAFLKDMDELNVLRPNVSPRATEHITEMIDGINALIERGHAYETDGDVHFSVESFPTYGKLSGRRLEDMQAGKRVDVDERKRHPMDFALWKSAKPGEPSWPSPWGEGRPGWHIECSVMSSKYLGFGFDIHGGGEDLIFPHHENEIAQAEGATGKEPFVRYWMHNGFLTIDKEKMAKSVGNFVLLREVLEAYDPSAIRLFFLATHYRSPLDYSADSLREAGTALERLRGARAAAAHALDAAGGTVASPGNLAEASATCDAAFTAAMDDDLNTAAAVGALFDLAKAMNVSLAGEAPDFAGLQEASAVMDRLSGDVLGISLLPQAGELPLPAGELDRLVAQRDAARAARDWAKADELRERLTSLGIVLEDTPHGTRWKLA